MLLSCALKPMVTGSADRSPNVASFVLLSLMARILQGNSRVVGLQARLVSLLEMWHGRPGSGEIGDWAMRNGHSWGQACQ